MPQQWHMLLFPFPADCRLHYACGGSDTLAAYCFAAELRRCSSISTSTGALLCPCGSCVCVGGVQIEDGETLQVS